MPRAQGATSSGCAAFLGNSRLISGIALVLVGMAISWIALTAGGYNSRSDGVGPPEDKLLGQTPGAEQRSRLGADKLRCPAPTPCPEAFECPKPPPTCPPPVVCPECPNPPPSAKPARKADILQLSSTTVCTAEMADRQRDHFKQLWNFVVNNQKQGWSFGCYGEESVLPAVWHVRPSKDFVYVDVGANKGQSLATVLNLWTDVSFHMVMESSKKPPACFFDMKVPKIYAVEPGPGNVGLLNGLKSRLPKLVGQQLEVHHLAMSASTGTVCMAGSQEAGNERATIANQAQSSNCPNGQWAVPSKTTDDWMREYNVNHIDYLKVDTEGFDIDVVHGAKNAMDRGAIDMISFEYHELARWRTESLEALVKWGEERGPGYDTYFIGDFQLYKLSQNCWRKEFEIKRWSNVWMVRRNYQHHDAIIRSFASGSCLHRDLAFICTRFGGRQPEVEII
jgi:FkbM family methyltransferase